MELTNKTIREIACEMPVTTKVFEELKIDYCCGGNKKFEEACDNANVAPEDVEEKISTMLQNLEEVPKNEFGEEVSPAKLIEFIVEKHHKFTRDEIVRLTPLMDKVTRKHGELHSELLEVYRAFSGLCEDLMPHMHKEEMVLFPHIKNLQVAEITNQSFPAPPFGTVKNPIQMMNMEHDAAGDFLREIRKCSNDFTLPEGACPSYKALYFGLEELEKDLHRHIHLENNLLFPLAIKMEEKSSGILKAQESY